MYFHRTDQPSGNVDVPGMCVLLASRGGGTPVDSCC